ncbi:hypothetical protein LTR62_005448 [Meristemomyces frigidus]|uniref:CENP-V/GFA domain-containing protein n=1 Tax=Meristemomyces frigidus TaxID=1508187 RepID=A0AAN7TKW4_9PEZI|nr:hypothetical protein LTR62_005448 [Meristemomyces frigidus]
MKGSCACSAVTWRGTPSTQPLDLCYCHTCQRVSGAPFIAWLAIESKKHWLTWTGTVASFSVSELATRGFCGACGSTLSMQYHCYPDKIHLAVGSVVEGGEGLPLVGNHIFVGEKAGWYVIPEDGVARWEGFDPGFRAVLERWRRG